MLCYVLARFFNEENLPRRSRKSSFNCASLLRAFRQWSAGEILTTKKNQERLGREGEEIALTPIFARFPPRFPRVRFYSLPAIGTPRSTI